MNLGPFQRSLQAVALTATLTLIPSRESIAAPSALPELDYLPVAPLDPRRFPPNPLNRLEADPLLPNRPSPDRIQLTEFEQEQLRSKLDILNQEASQLLASKKPNEAFLLWFRELRLRRLLGLREEIFALARVGETAWKNNRTRDLRDITERLQAIQIQIQPKVQAQDTPQKGTRQDSTRQNSNNPDPNTPDPLELHEYLALAYQILRSPQLALSIYEPRLQVLRERLLPQNKIFSQEKLTASNLDPIEAFKTLNAIGTIHLDWFRYEKASRTYADLLALSRLAQNPASEALYLIQLTYIAEQRSRPQEAIAPLEDLIKLYANQPEVQPALHLRLAENYDAAKQTEKAEQTYQAAFTLGQALSQNSYGHRALFKLGDLYRRTDRLEAAAQVYDYLVDAEHGAYDLHEAMKAADSLGQIRDQQKNYPAAIAAYEQAQAIALRLMLKPEALQTRLQIARQRLNK